MPETGECSSKIKIRAHHLLCMQGFQGYGYSQGFERNLEEIIDFLDSHPHTTLHVVAEVDVICEHCPHQKNGSCNKSVHSNFLMENMDLMVMKNLSIKVGQENLVGDLFFKVNEVFKTQKDVEDICGKCSWSEKCSWFLDKNVP